MIKHYAALEEHVLSAQGLGIWKKASLTGSSLALASVQLELLIERGYPPRMAVKGPGFNLAYISITKQAGDIPEFFSGAEKALEYHCKDIENIVRQQNELLAGYQEKTPRIGKVALGLAKIRYHFLQKVLQMHIDEGLQVHIDDAKKRKKELEFVSAFFTLSAPYYEALGQEIMEQNGGDFTATAKHCALLCNGIAKAYAGWAAAESEGIRLMEQARR